jgi:hypothetical protein
MSQSNKRKWFYLSFGEFRKRSELFIAAALEKVARFAQGPIDWTAVGALDGLARVSASGGDAVLADAALLAGNLVLDEYIIVYRCSILAVVVFVKDVWAIWSASLGTSKSGDFFHLVLIGALALKGNKKMTSRLGYLN